LQVCRLENGSFRVVRNTIDLNPPDGGHNIVCAMLHTLAVENYRSLRSIVVPLGRLNVIQGPNGSGKSNLYKALRLLADTAAGGVRVIELQKELGQTQVKGQNLLDRPQWRWE
jgi:ABC-type proline/glycine betaine transport system ATPase subunit